MGRGRNQKVAVIIVLALVTVLIGSAVMQAGILSGYGGMTAEIVGINDTLGRYSPTTFNDAIIMTGGSASLDIPQLWPLGPDPTGIRMELTSRLTPVTGAAIDLGTIQKPLMDPETGLEDGYELIKARIVPMTMGVTVRTYGFGSTAVNGIQFTVEIKENEGNYFERADETLAYIVDVYLINPPVTTDSVLMQVSPTVGGRSFDGEKFIVGSVPAWVGDSIATPEINYQVNELCDTVQAWFMVDAAQPALSWPFNTRTEQEASWEVGVDVLVFGYWKVTNDPPGFNPLEGLFKLWDAFLVELSAFLGVVGWVVFGVIIVVVLVIVFMIIRIMKQKDGPPSGSRKSRLKVFGNVG